jgi:hypothetical protein
MSLPLWVSMLQSTFAQHPVILSGAPARVRCSPGGLGHGTRREPGLITNAPHGEQQMLAVIPSAVEGSAGHTPGSPWHIPLATTVIPSR